MSKKQTGGVPMSEMTKEKQLARAQEVFPETTKETLNSAMSKGTAADTRYIIYGLKD